MNITKARRKNIAVAEKITEVLGNRLKKPAEKAEKVDKKVDLSKIAKDLAIRREKILNAEDKE